MKSTFSSILSGAARCVLACLCFASTVAPTNAKPPFVKSTGRIGSISGTITWPKAGNSDASRTGIAYLAKVTPSTSPNTFGTTSLSRIVRPAPVFKPGPVVARGAYWTQSYTLQKVPANQAIAVLINPADLKGIGPTSSFQRTSDPQWATCTVGTPLVTRFDFKMRAHP